MKHINRNWQLRDFIAQLVSEENYEKLSWADKLKIITLYEPNTEKNCDTMCTDFDEYQAGLIIKILNGTSTSYDRELLIDEMYMNIEHEVDFIIDQEIALKNEQRFDEIGLCLVA